jgi:oligopeptide transport system ATP-binding protein
MVRSGLALYGYCLPIEGGDEAAARVRPTVRPVMAWKTRLLAVRELAVTYRVSFRGGHALLRAVNGVSFELARGETLGLVGESGSGKSSIARALLRLVPVESGVALFHGTDLLALSGASLQAMRRHLQLIFQDPLASLDPRMRIADILAEPLRVFEPQLSRRQREQRVLAMAQSVGLAGAQLHRYPHEFSGGQAQRIGIARALIIEPELVVCDEPLSALDVSIKSQISNLLKDLQGQMQLSLLFISHDLAAVRFSCDRVLVLYLGRVMESAACDALFGAARHPYTRALMRAAPIPDPIAARKRRSTPLEGEVPSPLFAPSGCVFRTRCPMAVERCARETPLLRQVGASLVACHRAEEVHD